MLHVSMSWSLLSLWFVCMCVGGATTCHLKLVKRLIYFTVCLLDGLQINLTTSFWTKKKKKRKETSFFFSSTKMISLSISLSQGFLHCNLWWTDNLRQNSNILLIFSWLGHFQVSEVLRMRPCDIWLLLLGKIVRNCPRGANFPNLYILCWSVQDWKHQGLIATIHTSWYNIRMIKALKYHISNWSLKSQIFLFFFFIMTHS